MQYWCKEQLVVTVDGPTGQSIVSLEQPFAGSYPDSDIVFPDRALALRSVYLHATGAGVFCLYLDSADQDRPEVGTLLNAEREVSIGSYRVRAANCRWSPDTT